MTIELDDRTLNLLAAKVAKIVVKTLCKEGVDDVRLISCQEAASRLGISAAYLRQIKDRFTYEKRGSNSRSRLYFDADKLNEEYRRTIV